MSTFATQMSAQVMPQLLAQMAETITYVRTGAFSRSIECVFSPNEQDRREQSDGQSLVESATVLIWNDDTNGVSDPNVKADTITRGSDVWAVAGVTSYADGTARLEVRRVSTLYTGRGGTLKVR
ncbi:MAG: hypothetical protein AMXMBFR84_37820 [Candidatus Hydrogenedentota bacterium]